MPWSAQALGQHRGQRTCVLDHQHPHPATASRGHGRDRQRDGGPQAALRAGVQVEPAAVGRDDGRDDRQPEPGAAVRPGPVGGQPAERVPQPGHLGRVEDRAVGLHDQPRRRAAARGDPDPAAVAVVRDGVVDQVLDQPGQQRRAAPGPRRVTGAGLDREVPGRDPRRVPGEGVGDQVGERDGGLVAQGAVLGPGQREQPLQQPVDPVELGAHPPGQRPGLRRHRLRLGLGDVERGAHGGQRGAQLVGGGGHDRRCAANAASSRSSRPLTVSASSVTSSVRAGHRQPLVQAVGGDPPGGRGDRAQRPQHPPGQRPAQQQRDGPMTSSAIAEPVSNRPACPASTSTSRACSWAMRASAEPACSGAGAVTRTWVNALVRPAGPPPEARNTAA
jgi:hypothetical protein